MSTPSADAPATQGTLTFLFTDLEGSTDLRSRVGDEAADAVFLTHERLTRGVLEDAGPLETKYRGDGFLVAFASARQAIAAAVALQRAIDEHNQQHPGVPIRVRMGLNSGDVVQRSGEAYGIAVHAASRIADKAQSGQILCSQIVRDLAGMVPDIRIADRGLFWLKGLPTRWRLFEVLWRERGTRPRAAPREADPEARPGLDLPRSRGPVVGRVTILQAIEEELTAAARGGMRAVVLEGEAGIGKTRVLEAATERAAAVDPPCWVLSAAADEELRGPFLLFRTLLGDPRVAAIAEEAMALESLERARAALGGGGSFRDEGFTPQEQMLRMFDEVSEAVTALARERPLALLIDDLQWADEDSIRLVRYLVRTLTSLPIFMLLATRPHFESATSGAANLIADMGRMHLARRVPLERLSRAETATLLETVLAAPVAPQTVDSLHARSEGVPFFVEEFARAYREAKALQLIDGTWTMTRLSGPAVPASVQSLVARRLAQISDETCNLLADAAVLGRRFRLDDLASALDAVGDEGETAVWLLEDRLEEAVDAGIVSRLPEGSSHDYAFTHDQMRAALVETLSRQRRRAIHGAIASTLGAAGDAHLSALAYHAFHAGDHEVAVSSALRAARSHLEAHAPEESIRIVDSTLSAATEPGDRIAMLRVKDDALALLERGRERMVNLAEMGALTAALADPAVELEVKLRRASAARTTGDFDLAAELAGRVREDAAAAGDAAIELDACLELGQALTRSPLGEGFVPLLEVDVEAAAEPFTRALELARQIGDRAKEAASLRELAVLEFGRAKLVLMADVEAGLDPVHGLMSGPVRLTTAKELADEAFHIFEELGDRRGAMSALISTAYAHVTDPTPRGMAGRLEQVRRLHRNRKGFTTENQRAIEDAQMLYSIHVFARANAQPDLALERGRQAFEGCRAVGDRWLECLAAGGVAMALLSFGETAEAEAWVDRAAAAALAVPGPAIARRLETWRGALAAERGDGEAMVRHLEKAAELAVDNHSPGGRCESMARLAMEAARLGILTGDEWLVERAAQAAVETRAALAAMPGNLPWEAMAWAAECLVAQAQGRMEEAVEMAQSALALLQPRFDRTHYVDVLWAVGRVLITAEAPEAEDLAREILEDLWYLDQTIADPDIKSRWFAMPMQRELVELSGFEPMESMWSMPEDLDHAERTLLALLTSGASDREIAIRLDTGEPEVEQMVSALLEKLGLSSRLAATEFAVKAGIS
jgi:class 3 adenylate cyclase/DNA-binding CsgD family transcriptional regulator